MKYTTAEQTAAEYITCTTLIDITTTNFFCNEISLFAFLY